MQMTERDDRISMVLIIRFNKYIPPILISIMFLVFIIGPSHPNYAYSQCFVKYYIIESKLNGMVLDITMANPNAGAGVGTYWVKHADDIHNANQLWSLVRDGDYYFIKSKLNGMVLNVGDPEIGDQGALLDMYQQNSSATPPDKQLWSIPTDDSYGVVKSKWKGMVLDIFGANRAPALVDVYPAKYQDHQEWKLVPFMPPNLLTLEC
jgi:Ricin-type beta-trefoil lectin domain-like